MRTGFYEDYAIINLRQPGCSYTMRENSNSENELFELTAVGIKGKHQLLSQEVQGGKVRGGGQILMCVIGVITITRREFSERGRSLEVKTTKYLWCDRIHMRN